jgi:CRISPR/Cas system-associated exonuclease Cas4 (RecB family)
MDDYISASEIGEYLYCQRAWWLRVHGAKSSQVAVLEQGTVEHEVLAVAVEQVEQGSHMGRWLLWIGVALLVLLILVKLLAR